MSTELRTGNWELRSNDPVGPLAVSDIALADLRHVTSGRASRAGVFVAPRVVRVSLLGYGRIGQAVAAVAYHERVRLADAGVELHVVRALVRDLAKPRGGPVVRLVTSAAEVLHQGADVLVEVLGGVEPARTIVAAALEAGVPVISANKSLLATHGEELRALAARHRTTLAFDAAVLAGVPFLGSLARRPLVSAARRLEGVVNGTSQFIVGALDRGVPYERALAEAVARGYAEPDSRADTSGRDAAEKLTILLHIAGHAGVRPDDVPKLGLDALETSDLAGARHLGGVIRPIALATTGQDTGAWVGPAFISGNHPFAALVGVENALRLTGANGHTVTFAGPGAGPDATALTIIDDLVETVTAGAVRRPATAFGGGVAPSAATAFREPPPGRWFLSTSSAPASWELPLLQSGAVTGRHVALTSPLPWRAVASRQAALRAQGIHVLVLPVL